MSLWSKRFSRWNISSNRQTNLYLFPNFLHLIMIFFFFIFIFVFLPSLSLSNKSVWFTSLSWEKTSSLSSAWSWISKSDEYRYYCNSFNNNSFFSGKRRRRRTVCFLSLELINYRHFYHHQKPFLIHRLVPCKWITHTSKSLQAIHFYYCLK